MNRLSVFARSVSNNSGRGARSAVATAGAAEGVAATVATSVHV